VLRTQKRKNSKMQGEMGGGCREHDGRLMEKWKGPPRRMGLKVLQPAEREEGARLLKERRNEFSFFYPSFTKKGK